MIRITLILALSFFIFSKSSAQCPALIEEFGGDGIVMTNFSSTYDDRASASLRKPNGEIIIGGYTKVNGSVQRMAFAHYWANGQLNSTVTSGGKVVMPLASNPQTLTHMKWTADNKLLAGGYIRFITNDHFLFARFNADGQLDPGFNMYGWLGTLYHESAIDEVRSFEILPSGKIYAVGVINPVFVIPSKNMILIMLTPEGTRDSTFGENGMKEIKYANGTDDIAMCSLPSGSDMLIGGYFDDQEGDVSGFIMKATPTGTVSILGSYQPFGYKTYITNMIWLTDGNILATGFCLDGSSSYPLMLKVNPAGDLIESFGEGGYVIIETDQSTRGHKLVESQDAYFMMANVSGPFNIEVYRFYKNGTLNTNFADSGVMEIDYNNKADVGAGFHWLGNDTLLITGSTNNDFVMWKVDACVETTSSISLENMNIQLFPNPVSDVLTIRLNENSSVIDRLEFYDVYGRFLKASLKNEFNVSDNEVSISLNFLSPGVIFAKILSGERSKIVRLVKT